MINTVFFFLIIIGIGYSFFTGRIVEIGNTILMCASKSINMSISIFAVMTLWLGIMKIASVSGLLDKITNILKPILKIIFPEIPKNHESLNYISSNFVLNMFGLGNAATPFGLKAMKSLKELSGTNIASNSMITFLIINTVGFTIIPTTIISIRNSLGGNYSIIFITLLSSSISLFLALILNFIFRKVFK